MQSLATSVTGRQHRHLDVFRNARSNSVVVVVEPEFPHPVGQVDPIARRFLIGQFLAAADQLASE